MEAYKFEKKDVEQIEDLIKISSSIDSLYQKMCNLEINGKKNTEEYKKLLDNLHQTVKLENDQYSKYNLNYSKCLAWTNYLLACRLPKEFITDIESIMKQDYNNRITRRVLSTLINKMVSDHQSATDMLSKEVQDFVKFLEIPNPDKWVSNSIYSSIQVDQAIQNDIFNSYLFFLQESLDNSVYFKDELINSKYNISFINKDIESNLIINNFDIQNTLYINSQFVADLVQMDLILYNFLKNSNALKILTPQIKELLEISDFDYNDKNKAITSILRQCLIKATFLMMDDIAIDNVNNDQVFNIVTDKDYVDRHQDDKISSQLLINCFTNTKKDKNKLNILSLRHTKN